MSPLQTRDLATYARTKLFLTGLMYLPVGILAVGVAFGLLWYGRRLATSPDEAAGLAVAALAFAFACRGSAARTTSSSSTPSTLLFAAYAASFCHAPPLARAALGVTALAALVSRWRFGRALDPGFWLLLLLSLPVMPSLHFYCGYPLRRLAALAAAFLLRMQGLPVIADGAAFEWAGRQISVDAPCSGLKMVWTALVLAGAVSCQSRWGWRGTAATGLLALAVSLAANTWRACALFFVETNPVMPAWLHEGVGLLCFAATVAAIIAGAKGVERWNAAH